MKRVALFAAAISISLAQGDALSQLLSRLDAAAPAFKGVTADLKKVSHISVIDDTSTEPGQLKLQRTRGNDVRAIIDFTGEKDKRTLGFADRTVKVYTPNLALVQNYDLGRSVKFLNQYLLLGFGSSGKDLQKGYDISLLGPETIAGVSTIHLELVPKDKGAREKLAKAELWFPVESTDPYPIQQKFYEPNGNFTLITYSNVQLNPVFNPPILELKVPPNTREETPK
jgi:outer membrane lipoprotein-sorting protein